MPIVQRLDLGHAVTPSFCALFFFYYLLPLMYLIYFDVYFQFYKLFKCDCSDEMSIWYLLYTRQSGLSCYQTWYTGH